MSWWLESSHESKSPYVIHILICNYLIVLYLIIGELFTCVYIYIYLYIHTRIHVDIQYPVYIDISCLIGGYYITYVSNFLLLNIKGDSHVQWLNPPHDHRQKMCRSPPFHIFPGGNSSGTKSQWSMVHGDKSYFVWVVKNEHMASWFMFTESRMWNKTYNVK